MSSSFVQIDSFSDDERILSAQELAAMVWWEFSKMPGDEGAPEAWFLKRCVEQISQQVLGVSPDLEPVCQEMLKNVTAEAANEGFSKRRAAAAGGEAAARLRSIVLRLRDRIIGLNQFMDAAGSYKMSCEVNQCKGVIEIVRGLLDDGGRVLLDKQIEELVADSKRDEEEHKKRRAFSKARAVFRKLEPVVFSNTDALAVQNDFQVLLARAIEAGLVTVADFDEDAEDGDGFL